MPTSPHQFQPQTLLDCPRAFLLFASVSPKFLLQGPFPVVITFIQFELGLAWPCSAAPPQKPQFGAGHSMGTHECWSKLATEPFPIQGTDWGRSDLDAVYLCLMLRRQQWVNSISSCFIRLFSWDYWCFSDMKDFIGFEVRRKKHSPRIQSSDMYLILSMCS